jgi:Flp pilus assembly protein TadD
MKKNYQIVSRIFLIALIISVSSVLFGQNANREEGSDKLVYQWYINLNGGITQAYGDILVGSWHGDMLKGGSIAPGGGLRLGKHISPVFGIYGAFNAAQLKGESGKDTKNLEFETSLMEGYLGGTLSLTNLILGYKPRLINLYLTTGIGLINFSPTVYTKGTDNEIPYIPGKYEDYSNTTEAFLPVGGGIDFRLNNRWDINLETTLKLVDGDKLDGYVSGEDTDGYFYTSVGVGYSFGKGAKVKMDIETEPTILALHGDSIPIEVKGSFPESFNKKAVVDFTPVLKYGDKSKQLETMYFQGEDVAPEYQQSGAVVMPATGGSFTYKTYVKYEPGMEVCELYVEPMTSVKGRTPASLGDRKIADGLIMTSKRLENTEQLILADHGYQRDIVVTETGTIYYVVNRHELNFNYYLNKTDEAKKNLEDMDEFIRRGWEIKSVDIDAWASPEGEESFNQGLSERRSQTAQKYTQQQYDKFIKDLAKEKDVPVEELKKDIKFNLTAHGEDWNGFMRALQASDIKDKNIIANVVNSQSDLTKREQEIRNMTVIYKEIEEDILPPLRRAEIHVNAYEPSYTDDEIAQYATTAPDSLDVKEMLYAATLTDDANAKLNIYKTVIEKYPNDWRGYNNAGYASVELGNYDGAESYFAKARSLAANNGIVLNNTGAMASKDKNFKEAKEDYMAAQKQGVDVSYNMGIVKIADGNYNGAINSFGTTKCDYNLALAHTLSGNYNAATSTLNCAEKTAEVHYLQAIIGARTENDNMVFENLKKAIEMDASYRDIAIEDKEFLKYYSNPGFQNAIK